MTKRLLRSYNFQKFVFEVFERRFDIGGKSIDAFRGGYRNFLRGGAKNFSEGEGKDI